MKVLLINGSPHVKGCTATALEEIAKTLNECGVDTKISWIGSKPLSGCVACGYCKSAGQCAIDTDMVNVIGAELDNYDGFIFGSPVYFASPNGAMLAFMDRLFYSHGAKLQHKPAAGIVSCRRGGASSTFDAMNKYFTIRNMPVVSSTYWNSVHGNTPDEVRQDLEGMQVMRNLGKNMAWLLQCIEAGKQAGIGKPELEAQVKTNFIR
ncbi:MAG: flavodoxin family protein [Bacteroidales bacterium]|nr:flavodoxin family protein [Bacteroidales bacterium]